MLISQLNVRRTVRFCAPVSTLRPLILTKKIWIKLILRSPSTTPSWYLLLEFGMQVWKFFFFRYVALVTWTSLNISVTLSCLASFFSFQTLTFPSKGKRRETCNKTAYKHWWCHCTFKLIVCFITGDHRHHTCDSRCPCFGQVISYQFLLTVQPCWLHRARVAEPVTRGCRQLSRNQFVAQSSVFHERKNTLRSLLQIKQFISDSNND